MGVFKHTGSAAFTVDSNDNIKFADTDIHIQFADSKIYELLVIIIICIFIILLNFWD